MISEGSVEWGIVQLLHRYPKPATGVVIANAIPWGWSTVKRALRRLEREHWIYRAGVDGRAILWAATTVRRRRERPAFPKRRAKTCRSRSTSAYRRG